MNDNALSAVQIAMIEYEAVAPYWFVSRFDSALGEGTMSNLYNYNAMFLAKAYILKASRAELTKYLDAPGFERGNLFYIMLFTSINQVRRILSLKPAIYPNM